MKEEEIEQILDVKKFIVLQQRVKAKLDSTAEERLFYRHLVREVLPPAVAMLHAQGLSASQIVAMLRACHTTVRYYWLKCEHKTQARPISRWIWGIDDQGKPRRVRQMTEQERERPVGSMTPPDNPTFSPAIMNEQ